MNPVLLRPFGLAIAAAFVAGCAASSGLGPTPPPAITAVPTGTAIATPMVTAAPTAASTPAPTLRPPLEVAGQMTILVDTPATTLEGIAACDIPEGVGPAVVGSVRAQDVGRVGGQRVFAWVALVLEGAEAGSVGVEIGQGMENLPPGTGLPEYAGLTGPAGVESRTDGTQGTIAFTDLPSGERGFVGDGWPAAISGRISWTCDLIPPAPTPPPPGAVGTAVLSGALSATFAASGDDCPTVERPDGFMTGSALLDDKDAILNVTIEPSGEAWFVVYRTPGDREDVVTGRGRALVEADEGGGWRVRLAAVPTEIGPVALELRWRCER